MVSYVDVPELKLDVLPTNAMTTVIQMVYKEMGTGFLAKYSGATVCGEGEITVINTDGMCVPIPAAVENNIRYIFDSVKTSASVPKEFKPQEYMKIRVDPEEKIISRFPLRDGILFCPTPVDPKYLELILSQGPKINLQSDDYASGTAQATEAVGPGGVDVSGYNYTRVFFEPKTVYHHNVLNSVFHDPDDNTVYEGLLDILSFADDGWNYLSDNILALYVATLIDSPYKLKYKRNFVLYNSVDGDFEKKVIEYVRNYSKHYFFSLNRDLSGCQYLTSIGPYKFWRCKTVNQDTIDDRLLNVRT
jgi:hypothetical protein